jgi:hypothetical protein
MPSASDGQMKRPRSSRLANRHRPCPSCHHTLIRPPRRPRSTNRCPLCESCLTNSCTKRANHRSTYACRRGRPPAKPEGIWCRDHRRRLPLVSAFVSVDTIQTSIEPEIRVRPPPANSISITPALSGGVENLRLWRGRNRIEHCWNLHPVAKLLATTEQLGPTFDTGRCRGV